MPEFVVRVVARHRGPIVLIAIVAAAFAVAVWWLSMADASMPGCGGG